MSEGFVMDKLTLPVLPEEEQILISACLNNEQAAKDAVQILKHEDFTQSTHITLFAIISGLVKENREVNSFNVIFELRKQNKIDKNLNEGFVEQLAFLYSTNCDCEHYIKAVKNAALNRELFKKCREIEKLCCTPDASFLNIQNEAVTEILSMEPKFGGRFLSSQEMIENFKNGQSFQEILFDPDAKFDGYSTGYYQLDKMIGGLQNACNIIVGARSGAGKTTFLCNLVKNLVSQGTCQIGFFSLEMPYYQIINKMATSFSGVDYYRFQHHQLNDEEKERVSETANMIKKWPFKVFNRTSISVEDLRNQVIREVQQKKLDIVFIDYLTKLTTSHKTSNLHMEVGYISKALQAIALDTHIPIITLAQLNRQITQRTDKDKRPFVSDLRESGSIEEDADVILLLHRPDQVDPTYSKITELYVAKNRHFSELGKISFEFNRGILEELPDIKSLLPSEIIEPGNSLQERLKRNKYG
jgi:replicative DNA helicase